MVAGQQLRLDELAVLGGGSPHYMPVTWRGYWNMGAVLMLTQLKLAAH